MFPMKRVGEKGSGQFGRISWEEAYGLIAKKLSGIRKGMVRSRWSSMRVTRSGTSPTSFCVLPMPLVRRIFVLNRAPVSRHLPWHGSLYMGMGSVSRICRIRRRCFCGRVIFSIPIPQWGKCTGALEAGVTIIAVDPRSTVTTREWISTEDYAGDGWSAGACRWLM